jgi:hypothetical protein
VEGVVSNHDPYSDHLIIRIARLQDFSAWYRACLGKNWPGVQEVKEVNEIRQAKEVKENASNLSQGDAWRAAKTSRAKILG